MTTDFVLDADTGYDPKELPPVPVRIDGVVYTAHAPKDSFPILLSRLSDPALLEDPEGQQGVVHQVLLSTFDEETSEAILERLLDMSDRRFTLAYLIHVINKIAEHYRPAMDEQYAEMGVTNPMGAASNREERRALERGPAKKVAKKVQAKPAVRK